MRTRLSTFSDDELRTILVGLRTLLTGTRMKMRKKLAQEIDQELRRRFIEMSRLNQAGTP